MDTALAISWPNTSTPHSVWALLPIHHSRRANRQNQNVLSSPALNVGGTLTVWSQDIDPETKSSHTVRFLGDAKWTSEDPSPRDTSRLALSIETLI
jgi:hypothetical protein